MQDMIKQALGLFEAIGGTSSRNDKESLLQQGEKNSVFKRLLWECYNPYRVFNIKKGASGGTIGYGPEPREEHYTMFMDLLDKLHLREVTGNAAIDALEGVFCGLNEEERKWYDKVLKKDLKIGITDKTINKVFPDLIPVFGCALAHPLKKFPKRFAYDRKLDGYRCLARKDHDSSASLRTRNGKLIEGYTGVEQDVIDLLPAGYVFDGEIMARTGSFSDTQKDVFKKGKIKDGVFHIFDMIPVEEFDAGVGKTILDDRLMALAELNPVLESAACLQRVYPSFGENNEQDIARVYEDHTKFVAEGYEGTMVKDLDAVYKCKRSYDTQKIKDMETLDLVVVDVLEGEAGTKNEGRLGALVVEFEGYRVNVGSGYSDAQRDEFWATKNDLVNRIIEVKYQEVTNNQNGGKSLRFPVFMGFRHDK